MTGALERIKVMERLIRAGQVDTGVTRNIRMFRVSTIQEVVSVRVLVEDNSYLVQRKNEILSENPWGVPVRPGPEV